MTRPTRHAQAMALQGHRAGFISRVAADAIDLGVVWAIGLSVLLFAGVVRYLLAVGPFQLPVLPSWQLPAGGAVIAVAYLTSGWTSTGRTVGKQVAGLRVADRSGRRLPIGRALVRAVLYVLFPAGLLWVLVLMVLGWLQFPSIETPMWEALAPSGRGGAERAWSEMNV